MTFANAVKFGPGRSRCRGNCTVRGDVIAVVVACQAWSCFLHFKKYALNFILKLMNISST